MNTLRLVAALRNSDRFPRAAESIPGPLSSSSSSMTTTGGGGGDLGTAGLELEELNAVNGGGALAEGAVGEEGLAFEVVALGGGGAWRRLKLGVDARAFGSAGLGARPFGGVTGALEATESKGGVFGSGIKS